MDDLDHAGRAVAGQERTEDGLGELEVAEHEEAHTNKQKDECADHVRQRLQRDVEEDAGQASGLVDLLQGIGDAEHQDQLGCHEKQQPSLDLKTRREPPKPTCSRREPSGHLPRLHQRVENVQGYSGTTLFFEVCGLRAGSVVSFVSPRSG